MIKLDLSMEQQFELAKMTKAIEVVDPEKLRSLTIDLIRQNMMLKNAVKRSLWEDVGVDLSLGE